MKPEKTIIGTVEMICKIKITPDISFWDALKLRLMGRIPAARILTHILQEMKR